MPKNRPTSWPINFLLVRRSDRRGHKLFEDLVLCSQHVAESLPLLDSVNSIITILWSSNSNLLAHKIDFLLTTHKPTKNCVELTKKVNSQRGIATIH